MLTSKIYNILTADAFGVLPPVALLSVEEAMYHFVSGYTSKLAGTERGIVEPQATFSTCFGAPFMPLSPDKYAKLLKEKILKHKSKVYLLNNRLDWRSLRCWKEIQSPLYEKDG